MKKTKKVLLSLILILGLMMSFVPVAYADEDQNYNEKSPMDFLDSPGEIFDHYGEVNYITSVGVARVLARLFLTVGLLGASTGMLVGIMRYGFSKSGAAAEEGKREAVEKAKTFVFLCSGTALISLIVDIVLNIVA